MTTLTLHRVDLERCPGCGHCPPAWAWHWLLAGRWQPDDPALWPPDAGLEPRCLGCWERCAEELLMEAALAKAEREREMTGTILRTDTIACPECGLVQEATATWEPGHPWPTYLHHCAGCGYTITESEWERVAEAGRDSQRDAKSRG